MAWEENSRICLHMQLIAILSRTGVFYVQVTVLLSKYGIVKLIIIHAQRDVTIHLAGILHRQAVHTFVPQKTFARHLAGTGWRSVIKSATVGIPLPLCSCGVLPAVISMRRNGASRAAFTSFFNDVTFSF